MFRCCQIVVEVLRKTSHIAPEADIWPPKPWAPAEIFPGKGKSRFPCITLPSSPGGPGVYPRKNILSCICLQANFDVFWSRESITSYHRFNASGDIFWPLLWDPEH